MKYFIYKILNILKLKYIYVIKMNDINITYTYDIDYVKKNILNKYDGIILYNDKKNINKNNNIYIKELCDYVNINNLDNKFIIYISDEFIGNIYNISKYEDILYGSFNYNYNII
jgi:hypothetical protein